MTLSKTLFLFILLYISYCDIKHSYVNDRWFVLLIVLSLVITYSFYRITLTIILFTFCTICYKRIENYIGGADIKLMLIYFYFSNELLIYSLAIASLFGIMYAKLMKVQSIRFIPFLVLGFIINVIC